METRTDATTLQFNRAEYSEVQEGTRCGVCQEAVAGRYYLANGQTLCERCSQQIGAFQSSRLGASGVLRAVAAGVGAAIGGAILYYIVLALTGYEIGLIAIVVGFMVGRAVRWGSGGLGGALCQAIAVVLTYVAIVSTYVPFIVRGIREGQESQQTQETAAASPASPREDAPLASPDAGVAEAAPTAGRFAIALGAFALFVLLSPFLAGFQNIIGWLIIGFALYEAWRVNRRVLLEITGPYELARHAPSAPSTP